MLKWTAVTAALLALWSLAWFVNVVYLDTGGGVSLACTRDATKCPGDNGPRDILVWVIGLVAIIAVRVCCIAGGRVE